MSVAPSCPAFVIHDDGPFRKSLITALDVSHFAVTFATDDDATAVLEERPGAFRVILLGLDLAAGRGVKTVEYLRTHREEIRCGLIILGEPTPELRTFAPWADETLMKPVDAQYVAARARSYCGC